jgi:hypothetical protein
MLIYSVNDFLQNDATILSLSEKEEITIFPMVGYDEEVAPIIIYDYLPDIKDEHMFYIHHDRVIYSVLDVDAERGFAVRNEIISKLNQSDEIQLEAIDDTYGRMLYMNLVRSTDRQPTQPEGYYQFISIFEMCWIPND